MIHRLSMLWMAVVVVAGLPPALASERPAEGARFDPLDWPHWRGPELNMISREKGLVDTWSRDGENLLWKRDDLGTRSTPVVMNGRLYFLARHKPETKEEGEKVVCLDAATGETVWEHVFNVFLSDVPDTRVGWSSVVADPDSGNVFALGVCDLFLCLDGETGKLQWSHSLGEEYGMLDTYGGRTNFPIVHEDLVIISGVVIGWGEMAKPAHRFIAFDKRNGQAVWYNGTRLLPDDTTYSSPVLAVVDGQSALVFASGDGALHAFQTRTGKPLWKYEASQRGINTTPVIAHDLGLAICGHSEENVTGTEMGALFAVDLHTGKEVWRNTEWYVGKSSPLYVDGRIYAAEDGGTLLVADAKTGEKIAEQKLRGPMRSSPLYADGKIYLMTENGIWWVFRPTSEGLEQVVKPQRMNAGEAHGSLIVSHGRMYIPTTEAMYCVGKEGQTPQADPIPEQPVEAPLGENDPPALVQVVPVEVLMKPGQRQEFAVRLYNERGQWLNTLTAEECELSIEGPGDVKAYTVEKAFEYDDGSTKREKVRVWKYTAPPDKQHSAVLVTARAGELTGSARIRVIPTLPWDFDFDNGEVPITWVGARYRHIPLDFDLYSKLRAENPTASALYIYLTSEFVNSGKDSTSFDNTTPAQRWTDFQRFHDLATTPLDETKQTIDKALELLKSEEVVSDWSWSSEGPIKLSVNRGPRNRAPRKVDGNGVMVKIATIPKGTRSQGWMGHPEFSGYTVQADVLGAERDGQLPDIGLIGQRYAIVLMGNSQQLQIRTWHPQLRMAETVAQNWEPFTWYTLKLQASVENGQAVLRGKLWPKDGQEPAEWLIEATDPAPNRNGSPGLFGDATPAEIFYDNLRVYPNG
ncbi:MAG: PQQ-binding-like beta-propeller repeat protein [Planctomycetes bacterium]|nr:PQQ-binding-like beta-propeller repeat protein [Planctomycetota bacterium]